LAFRENATNARFNLLMAANCFAWFTAVDRDGAPIAAPAEVPVSDKFFVDDKADRPRAG